MSTPGNQLSESDRGYLSEESKRRFTVIAGVLGAAFFVAQFVLPMLFMFLFVMSTVFEQELKHIDLEQAAVLRDELWAIERTIKPNWRKVDSSETTFGLARVRLADLTEAGPTVPLGGVTPDSSPALLTQGDRLWV